MSNKTTHGTDLSRTVANILAQAGYDAAGNTERERGGCFRWFRNKEGRKFLVIEDHETVAVLEVVGTGSDSERVIEALRARISKTA